MIAGHNVTGGFTSDSIKNLGFPVGSRVKVWTKIDKTKVIYEGRVVGDYDWFFNIEVKTKQCGSFIISINKSDLVTEYGNTKVRKIA